MADFDAIFGDDGSDSEEFTGFNLDNLGEAEERYLNQLNVLNNFDSDIEISDLESSDFHIYSSE